MIARLLSAFLLVCTPLGCASSDGSVRSVGTPIAADAFVDSVGINIHLHNRDTPYGNFPVIAAALRELGVRHTRDGLIPTTWPDYYLHHAELARAGIHCDFITGPDRTDAEILHFLADVHGSAEALEGPNEYDRAGDPLWASRLSAFMPRLYALAKGLDKPLEVIGPTLLNLDSPGKTPHLAASFDAANMHNYFAGHFPGTSGWGDDGYGSILWNLKMAREAWGDKPVITTETGYLTDTRQPQAITERVQAAYLPRVLLEQKLHGIDRTYLYELSDGSEVIPEAERSFGLLRSDGSRKPAYLSLQRMMLALADAGPPFPGRSVAIRLSGPPQVHHLLLQKRNGDLYLAFWVEVTSQDARRGQILPGTAIPITVSTQQRIGSPRLLTLDATLPPEARPVANATDNSLSLIASDHVSLVSFRLSE